VDPLGARDGVCRTGVPGAMGVRGVERERRREGWFGLRWALEE